MLIRVAHDGEDSGKKEEGDPPLRNELGKSITAGATHTSSQQPLLAAAADAKKSAISRKIVRAANFASGDKTREKIVVIRETLSSSRGSSVRPLLLGLGPL